MHSTLQRGGINSNSTAAPTNAANAHVDEFKENINEEKSIFITHVDSVGPCLKLCGQLNPNIMPLVQQVIERTLPTCTAIDPTWSHTKQQALLLRGMICVYKRRLGAAPGDVEYRRARISNVIAQNMRIQVELELVDWGTMETVASKELLFPQQPEMLQEIPFLSSHYIVMGVCMEWTRTQLDEIFRLLYHQTVKICIKMEFNKFKFITMIYKEFDFAEYLIHHKKLGAAPIADELLRDIFRKLIKEAEATKTVVMKESGFVSDSNSSHKSKYSAVSGSNNNNINNNNYFVQNQNKHNNNNILSSSNSSVASGVIGYNQNPAVEAFKAARSISNRLLKYKQQVLLDQQQQQQQEEVVIPQPTSPPESVRTVTQPITSPPMLQQPQLQKQPQHRLLSPPQIVSTMPRQVPNPYITPQPILPRMPQTIGNLRSMTQVHNNFHQNRLPYARQLYVAPAPMFINPMLEQMPMYAARHHRPTPAPFMRPALPVSRRNATFRTNSLSVNNVYEVNISYVENGPCLFSVQLFSSQDDLTEMMNQIEKVQLRPFSEKPMLGTACIARYSEDGQLYRALITAVQPTACKVAYIDYGNAELVNYHDLFEIPDEFLIFKAFAIRFTLSGHKELEPLDESIKKTFKDLVIYQKCKLKVMPLEGPPLVQYCELYLQDRNILDVLKDIQKCRLVYPKAESLQNNDIVEIRYIDSPKNFYVQKVCNIDKFQELMDEMYLYYNKNQMVPNNLTLGAPCIVKFDNEWYRAEVMRADATAIVVRHVDFGYEQKVTKNLISNIAEKHLKLPRQAVQCCLKGFEKNELKKDDATNQFEMLAEESNRQRRSFTVKVFRIQPDGVHLVNLCTKEINVMKKLYKLSMPFEQYLTLEKEDFNLQAFKQNSNGSKTPSIASSSDVPSSISIKKKAVSNSTPIPYEERREAHLVPQNQQQLRQSPHQQQQQQQLPTSTTANKRYVSKMGNQTATSIEWDKTSSTSSMDNRDSRSSSSEQKQKRTQQQQLMLQQRLNRNELNSSGNVSSSDCQSNISIATTASNMGYRQQSKQLTAGEPIVPRWQQHKNLDKLEQNAKKRQQHRQQQQLTQQQQRREQRSQNAPQGYSQQQQQRHKSKDLNSSQSSDNASINSPTTSTVPDDSTLKAMTSEEYVPLNFTFNTEAIATPSKKDVIISWWISPFQFFTHLKTRLPAFESLMQEMQQFYRKKPLQHLQLKVGSSVVARYRKDNTLYRARVLACNQMLRKYKVHFVDCGNQYTVTSEDIWQLEQRFAKFPIMAYRCSFDKVVANYDHLYLIDRMEKYLPPGATLQCEYAKRQPQQDLYLVNVSLHKNSLKATLIKEGILSEVDENFALDLLAGQQIRAKICSIRDMLNFKIQIEACAEKLKFLCSYDDVRFVKSNPDVAQKFKQFYEGKSCVLNIKEVNDNKVIQLRPLLPLLKEDIPTYICTYPICYSSFLANVVYISCGYRLYAQALATSDVVDRLLDDMYEHYEAQGDVLLKFDVDQICAAKGSDDNWYRARIAVVPKNANENIEVYYIDYGNTELIARENLKQLEPQFYVDKSAFGIELNLPIRLLAEQSKNKGKIGSQKTAEEHDKAVVEALTELTSDKSVTVKPLEVRHNHVIADIYTSDGKSLIELLKERQLIKGRDVDYMRKQLDKDKSNMLTYIELVDLTLEDEEESDKKLASKSKSNTNSPKKQKKMLNTNVEAKVETVQPQVAAEEVLVPVIAAKQSASELSPDAEPAIVNATEAKPAAIATDAQKSESDSDSLDIYAGMEHGFLSSCVNPTNFFIQPADKLPELYKLQENLQIVANQLPPLKNISEGTLCISQFSVDKIWYRAKVLDAELVCLRFIDFGHQDCLNDVSEIKDMQLFNDCDPLCMPFALPIKPSGRTDWVDAANAIFIESFQKQLNFEYITHGDFEKRSFINLYIDGVNVADKLVAQGYAEPLQLVQSGENCYICHVNGINDFYIQYEKDAKALEMIEIYLSENAHLQKLQQFNKDKIVAAQFADDEMWYRAKLLKQMPEGGGYEVLFIDYGNKSISAECREISVEIANVPPLSKKCALELPETCAAWSEAAEKKFAEISALGETIFTVELREPAADHAIVHLLVDGHNINEDLEPLCERKQPAVELNASFGNTTIASALANDELYDAVISHINTLQSFYVQWQKDVARLEDLTNSLNTLGMSELQQPQIGQLCAAVFEQDGALYRARILEVLATEPKYRVLFLDYGNVELSRELRILPQDLQQLKPLCRHCQLHNAQSFESFQSVSTETLNALLNETQAAVKVEILGDLEKLLPDEQITVKLYHPNTHDNLYDKLEKLLLTGSSSTLNSQTKAATTAVSACNDCVMSHVISPMHFYVQLKCNSSKMDLVNKTLKQTKLEAQNAAAVGATCVVYSTEENGYCRARVLNAAKDGYEVQLLDVGSIIKVQQLYVMPMQLRDVPALAMRCELNAVPAVSDELLEQCFANIVDAHFAEVYEIETQQLNEESGINTVKLQINYKDVAELLAEAVQKGTTALHEKTLMPELVDCSVILLDMDNTFYVQLSSDTDAVMKITDELLDAEYNFEPFTVLAEGALCAAQFPDDLVYYRARILNVLEDGKCEVVYLDFGNRAVTDQFRQLPESMQQIEPYAKHCAVEIAAKDGIQFADFIDQRFSETFQIELLKTDTDPQICRLYFQNKNVATQLDELLLQAEQQKTTTNAETVDINAAK